jgi:uncharacterized protein YqgC (DUF456 family)
MSDVGTFFVGVAILVGVIGVVVPVLPGALLVVAAILVWSFQVGGLAGWLTFAVAVVFVATSQVLKYAVPGRQMRAGGVPSSSLVWGALLGIAGFFVIPVVGLVVGFVLGVYAAERRRLLHHEESWASTKLALKAVGLSMIIELAGACLAAGSWLLAVIVAT